MNTLITIFQCFFFLFTTISARIGVFHNNDTSNIISLYMHNVFHNPFFHKHEQNYKHDLPDLSLRGREVIEGLEFGPVTAIDEALYQYLEPGSPVLIGSAQGIYVANSDIGYMVAIKAFFSNGDGLRFFGVHEVDAPESYIAVIGGTGKYRNANGYASVKTLDLGSNGRPYKLLLFNVHLG